jgi:tRNA A-37 threonylcarbamoyl transferase component Bud32
MKCPLYRRACLRAISLAGQLDLLSPELEAFLEPFISGEVLDEDEARAFYLWARHLWNRSFGQAAARTLKRLLAARPDHAAATELLGRIEKTDSPGRHGGRILEDEASLTHRVRDTPQPKPRFAAPPLPPAPDLPDPLAVWKESTRPHLAPQATQTLDRGAMANSTPPERPSAVVNLVSLAPGMTIAGRYRLGPKLGRGGTAVVFQATDLEMGEEIAIKIFTSHELDPAMNERFKRELRLSRQLSHPDILRLYDLGFFGGHLYITMELLTGTILRQRLGGGRLEPATAVRYLVQICDGLQAMHDLGIVHRDLKPENLFVTRGDRIKIMDLGIAKKMAASNLTSHGWLWGTPRYMSPEQISDFSRVTASADLYSLGVVAYEMLTGAVPFDHPDVESVMVMQLRERPVPPRTLSPQVPQALDELVMQLLEKAPERRPKSCREVRGRLEAAGQRPKTPSAPAQK